VIFFDIANINFIDCILFTSNHLDFTDFSGIINQLSRHIIARITSLPSLFCSGVVKITISNDIFKITIYEYIFKVIKVEIFSI